MTLAAPDLISAYKSVPTKLVQLGVTDLSPAAVTRKAVSKAVSTFTGGLRHSRNHRPENIVFRACFDPGYAIGLLQSKRCAGPLREEEVERKLKENLKLLTTVQICKDEQLENDLEQEVRRTVKEIRQLNPKWRLRKCPAGPAIPNTTACFEYPRNKGGSLGYWADNWGNRGYPGKMSPDTTTETIKCRRAGVLEPFKLRVISAGEAEQYAKLHLYQNSLWSLLAKIPTFSLIGQPLTEKHIRRWWRTARTLFGSKALALAGDYSAATDNLNPNLSRAAMDALIDEGAREDYDLLIAGLTGHIIDPDHTGKHPAQVGDAQQWGQLMGSPVSFPILCIVNAAVCRAVTEKLSGRRLDLSEAGILVNGDDCLVPLSKPEDYEYWRGFVEAAGLKPSPGKCFVSSRFAQLNSATYAGDGGRLVPFLRTNLLWGLRAKGMGAGKDDLRITTDRTYLPTCLFKQGWTRAQYAYIRKSFREISREYLEATRPIPLHLHPSWGGLGIPYLRKRGAQWHIGPIQLHVVARLLVDPDYCKNWVQQTKLSETLDPTGLQGQVAKAEIAWRRDAVLTSHLELVKKKGAKQKKPAPLPYILNYLYDNRDKRKPVTAEPNVGASLRTKAKANWARLLKDAERHMKAGTTTADLVTEMSALDICGSLTQLAREGTSYIYKEVVTETPNLRECISDPRNMWEISDLMSALMGTCTQDGGEEGEDLDFAEFNSALDLSLGYI
jgi:hypothetical protein